MEHTDQLKNTKLKIIQDDEKFCFGIDAVLLADFVKAKKTDSIADLCTGNGIIPILLSANTRAEKIAALEVQPVIADMALRSIQLNELENRVSVIQGDLKNIDRFFKERSFSVVTCNPPYMTVESGKINPSDFKSIARHEVLCNVDDVVKAAKYLLKPCGSFFMIHRPNRLSDIFRALLKYNLEPKRMQLIYPFADKKPTMVMIEARNDAKPDLIVEEPLVVYEKPGVYTSQVNRIYEKV